MEEIEPIGKAHVAGTFCGHPISLAAAKATIEQLEDGSGHDKLMNSGEHLRSKLSKIIEEEKIPAQVKGFKSIFTVYFTEHPLRNYRDVKQNNNDKMFDSYCRSMHKEGIFIAPQAYKRSHISIAHDSSDLRKTVDAARVSLAAAKETKPKGYVKPFI
jgi:glutamate-1-semialdehyde 2,1-aminomutase